MLAVINNFSNFSPKLEGGIGVYMPKIDKYLIMKQIRIKEKQNMM